MTSNLYISTDKLADLIREGRERGILPDRLAVTFLFMRDLDLTVDEGSQFINRADPKAQRAVA